MLYGHIIVFRYRNPALELTAAPALAPKEVDIDPSLLNTMEQELESLANQPLPEEDDDL